MADNDSSEVLTLIEAGKLLSVSDETAKRYLQSGKLKGFKLPGGYYRVFRTSVDDLMSKGIADGKG